MLLFFDNCKHYDETEYDQKLTVNLFWSYELFSKMFASDFFITEKSNWFFWDNVSWVKVQKQERQKRAF